MAASAEHTPANVHAAEASLGAPLQTVLVPRYGRVKPDYMADVEAFCIVLRAEGSS